MGCSPINPWDRPLAAINDASHVLSTTAFTVQMCSSHFVEYYDPNILSTSPSLSLCRLPRLCHVCVPAVPLSPLPVCGMVP
jgi:hypothetical protein